MLCLMKFGFNNKIFFIFQNKDDYKELLDLKVLKSNNTVLFIKGSGVNLNNFYPTEFPSFKLIKIVLPTRMLWDKGVNEFLVATNHLKKNMHLKFNFF